MATALPRRTPSSAFLALLLPFGVSSGFVSVTLAYQLAERGMATGAVATLVALSVWPQTWKVLWAPIVDTTLTLKGWYVIGTVAVALSLVGLGLAPLSGVGLLGWLIVLSSVASTISAMAAEAMMAEGIEDARRGIVSGWGQAANLGGVGLGGGLALWLSQHVQGAWLPGTAAGLLCLACAAALPLVHLPTRDEARRAILPGLVEVGRELWRLVRSRVGLLAVVLMLLPIGSGGAGNLWSAVADDWRAGADTVALVNGVLGGVASLIGAVIGGVLCDRLPRRAAYCLFGAVLAMATLAMAFLPRTPLFFVTMTLAYAVILGACYAAYSAVVLEAIGTRAAATKFQLLSAIANVPIALLVTWDGQFHDRGGATGMLLGETACGVGAILFFALFVVVTRRLWPHRKPNDRPVRAS